MRMEILLSRQSWVNKQVLEDENGEPLGIRVSTIWGAVNSYIQDLVNLIGEEGESPGPIPDNPHVYTWVEIALLTDGTMFVRVPDASIFPRHVLYVNNLKSDTNGFTVSEDASDDGYSARYNENTNNVWEAFRRETEGGIVVPYRTPHNCYVEEYDSADNFDNFPGHPVMVYGVNKNGDVIPDEHVDDILGEPLDPFPTGELN